MRKTVVRKTLTAQAWAEAALAALAAGGVPAVAVEPIAAGLGATKGSFYHHFRTRDELLGAALELWERQETEQVIQLIEQVDGAQARLDRLLRLVLDATGRPRANAVEPALQAHASHARVAPVLHRVTRRRLDYLAELFRELGFDAADAQRRALLAYTAYLGHAQLAHATPDLAPGPAALPDYADLVITTLVSVGGAP